MRYHVLNGDAMATTFQEAIIPGEIVVAREGLIDGDLTGKTLEEFWQNRAAYIGITPGEYSKSVAAEFEKIIQAPAYAEFNLWFEYDLFCQVNMWFVLSLINELLSEKKVFVVYSTFLNKGDKNFWNGYGPATADQIRFCFDRRIELTKTDLQFGALLWDAYKHEDLEKLSTLAMGQSPSFPYIQEVIQAHIDRFPRNGQKGRPEQVIEDIATNISSDFQSVFREFWKRESIYGFGDVQLKKIYDEVVKHS